MRISLPSKPKEDEVGVGKPNPTQPNESNPTQSNPIKFWRVEWVFMGSF